MIKRLVGRLMGRVFGFDSPQPLPTEVVTEQTTQAAPVAGARKKRFRRTLEEIQLGLSAEDAMKRRSLIDRTKKIEAKGKKRKGFRRTKAEIAAGLSPTQAKGLRKLGAALEQKPSPKKVVEKTFVTKRDFDPIDELDEPTKTRAKIVRNHYAKNGKTKLSADEITQIQNRIQSGAVVRLPPGMDSQGYNHFTGEAR